MDRRGFIYASGASALLAAGRLNAQGNYPAKPIQMLVGFPGGGALDVATRLITNALAEEGIAPIAIINKAGASATIATAQAAKSAPDGYTALLGTSANLGVAPYLYTKLSYVAEKDLLPVAQFGVGQNVIYVSSSLGITDLKQLITKISGMPGKLNYASPGAGTTAHLCFEMFKASQKLFIVHVPFRGSPAAITSVLGGELDIGVDAIGPTLAYIRSGKLIPIAQTGTRRSASLPEVPTLGELGVGNIPSGTFLGIVLPTGTSPAIASQWSEAIRRVVGKPAIVNQLRQVGIDAAYLDAAAFAAAIAGERKLWEGAVKYSGATSD